MATNAHDITALEGMLQNLSLEVQKGGGGGSSSGQSSKVVEEVKGEVEKMKQALAKGAAWIQRLLYEAAERDDMIDRLAREKDRAIINNFRQQLAVKDAWIQHLGGHLANKDERIEELQRFNEELRAENVQLSNELQDHVLQQQQKGREEGEEGEQGEAMEM